jgi:hypothetical protein
VSRFNRGRGRRKAGKMKDRRNRIGKGTYFLRVSIDRAAAAGFPTSRHELIAQAHLAPDQLADRMSNRIHEPLHRPLAVFLYLTKSSKY